MEYLSGLANGVGLGSFGFLGTLLISVVILLIVVKLFTLPIKFVWNGLMGAAILWLFNFVAGFFGFTVKITILKALIAGFFGVVGAAAVILYEFFG